MGVDREDPGEGVGGAGGAADAVERLLLGCLGVDGDELGAHQAAGGQRLVAEQGAQAALLDVREEVEDVGAAVVVELGEQVGGVVGLHPGDQVGDLVVVAVFGELELVLVAEFLEHVGFELGVVVDGGDDLLALAVRCGLDEVGELGRVEAGELRVRDAQLDRRDVAGERLEARPVEEVGDADAPGATARGSSRRSRLRGLDVDADDAPPAFDAGDLDLVRAHEPGAVDVDQLPVEQVLAQQQLALAALERLQVEPRLGEGDAAVLDLADLLGRDEDEPSRRPWRRRR